MDGVIVIRKEKGFTCGGKASGNPSYEENRTYRNS